MSKGTDKLDASGSPSGYTRDEAERIGLGKDHITSMNKILKMGVPIVLSSGNEGDKGRKEIDMIPQVLEKEDFPVINVGAASLDGKAMSWSQGQGTGEGTQLTIYGIGDNVELHNHEDGDSIRDSGTSFAAPAVAGIIAVHSTLHSYTHSMHAIPMLTWYNNI
jgi:hypothetical protein